MAIRFEEIKQYIACNVRVSICFEDGCYHNYTMISDVPDFKYDNLFVYGVGMADVEFSRDVYANIPNFCEDIVSLGDETLQPAIEIVLHESPRYIERMVTGELLFRDLRPYLQIIGSYSIVNREDWSSDSYVYKRDIPDDKYDNMYVYGISMEDNQGMDEMLRERDYDSCLKKRMVVVLSRKPREDIIEKAGKSIYGKGPFFLLITAEEWNHDADEWIGIYTDKKEAGVAYDRAQKHYEEERKQLSYCNEQKVTIFEFIAEEDIFRKVERRELE